MLSLCSRKHNAANHRQTAPLCCQASLCNSALAPLCHFPHSSPSFFRSHFPRSHDPTFFPLFSPFTNLSHLCVSWNPVQLKLESLSYCGCCSVTKLCLTLCNLTNCSTPGPLSITNSRSLLKLMSIESVMPSNSLILCSPFSSCPQSFPALGSFLMSPPFASGGQSIRATASVSVSPMNIQD